jgi:hypothetical protein
LNSALSDQRADRISFEGICELKKMPTAGAERPIAKIDQKIEIARFRAECVSRSLAKKFLDVALETPGTVRQVVRTFRRELEAIG